MTASADAVKQLLQQQQYGVLSTQSVDLPGFPFGSVTPYALTPTFAPLIYISNIALHTKNILSNDRVALTVLDSIPADQDPQQFGRVTVVGQATQVSEPEQPDLYQTYFKRFPDAEQVLQSLGFDLFRIEPVRIRYIGGFGKIFWLDPGDLGP